MLAGSGTGAAADAMSMQTAPEGRPYGIRTTLPAGAPLAEAHLLGPDFEAYTWFATASERDAALAHLRQRHPWSRPGDVPAIECHSIDP